MTDYAPITTSGNTFHTQGLSLEVRALLDYLLQAKEAGLDVVCTCTTDHAKYSAAGRISRHVQAGSEGKGLAIDCRLRRRGNDIHRAVFDVFTPVEDKLHELIYAGAPYNIKAGKRVPPYAVSTHHDHVHVAVNVGTYIRWPGLKRPEPRTWKWENHMPQPLEITSAVACPTGGYWEQSAEGGIYAEAGAPYLGAYNTMTGQGARLFMALVATPGGGYIQIATTGEHYQWDPK